MKLVDRAPTLSSRDRKSVARFFNPSGESRSWVSQTGVSDQSKRFRPPSLLVGLLSGLMANVERRPKYVLDVVFLTDPMSDTVPYPGWDAMVCERQSTRGGR